MPISFDELTDWEIKPKYPPPPPKPTVEETSKYKKRNPPIVKKDNWTRYRVTQEYSYNPTFKQRIGKGKCIFIVEYPDRLYFTFLKYDSRMKDWGNSSQKSYILKFKKGKFRLYDRNTRLDGGKRKIKDISNRANIVKLSILDKFKKPKTSIVKINKILGGFIKKFGIKVKLDKNDLVSNLTKICYPHITDLDFQTVSISSIYSRHFIHGDIKYVIKQCFGYDSKKLVSLVCQRIEKDKNLDILILGKLLKGLIPLDYFYKLIDIKLGGVKEIGTNGIKFKDGRKLVKHFNSARLLKLFSGNDVESYNFTDSFRIYSNYVAVLNFNKKAKNWREVHDTIAPTVRYRMNDIGKNIEHFDLPITDKYKEIDGAEFDGFKIEIPKNTKDLTRYSDKLSNCIRNYSYQIINNNCKILGIYKNNKLFYNISIYDRQINQFKGKFNNEPVNDDSIIIKGFLIKAGIIN